MAAPSGSQNLPAAEKAVALKIPAAPAESPESDAVWTADLPPALPQPASVRPATDARVVPASAERPLGIQLVNPAAAVVVDPGEDGLQQAIYYEASDAVEASDQAAP
jgi:hypothetical protein